ncbi:MAG TPA: ABC transporter permease [Anaerolineae bacterium]|nr:ABC transporter permease [Anaerolineae bacterium]
MGKMWIIARHEYLIGLRRAGFIIMTALVPLLGLVGLLVAAFFGGQAADFLESQFAPEPRQIGVVDRSGIFTPILPAYRDRYHPFADEEAGQAALLADEITTLLVIPADYVESGRVTVISKGSGFGAAAMEDSASARAFFVDHLLRGQVESALRQRAARPLQVEAVTISSSGETHGGGPLSIVFTFVVPYFLAVLLIMTIFVSSGYLLQSVVEEKTSRVIEIVLSSVTAWELLAGKVIGLGALGLTQVFIWLLSAWGLSGGAVTLLGMAVPLLARPEVLVLSLVYYLLGFLVYAVLMGAVGALGTTMRESQQLAGIFSMAVAIPMMMSGLLFSNPNATLVRALSWFPLTAPTMMMMRLPLAEVPVVDVVGSILALIVSIPALLWAGAKVFRMGLLMYGKRPTLAQIISALREA